MSDRPVLDYQDIRAKRKPNLAHRRELIIYGAGVVIAWLVQFQCYANYPHTSNSLDIRKDEIILIERLAGGAAAAWLFMGIRWLRRSPRARFDWRAWILVIATAVASVPVLQNGAHN